jgi:hypothetical protein
LLLDLLIATQSSSTGFFMPVGSFMFTQPETGE